MFNHPSLWIKWWEMITFSVVPVNSFDRYFSFLCEPDAIIVLFL